MIARKTHLNIYLKFKVKRVEEFDEMCLFHQTSSESHFTKGIVIYFLQDDKKITLTDKKLKIRTLDNIVEKEIHFEESKTNRKQFEQLLFEHFSIKL